METKTLSLAGLAVGCVALVLALVALATRPEGSGGLKEDVAALTADLGELKGKLANSPWSANDVKLAKLTGRIDSLERTVSSLAARPAAEVDEGKLRELVQAEFDRRVREFTQRRAGDWRDQGERRGRGMDAASLQEQLGIDQEKAEKIAQIHSKMREGMDNIWRDNMGGDRDKNRELTRQLHDDTEEKIADLLTPEQAEKYRQMQQRPRRGWGRRGRDRGGDGDEQGGEPARERHEF